MMEIHRKEFHDARGEVWIAQILPYMHVEVIRVRIQQARRHARQGAQEVLPRPLDPRRAAFLAGRQQNP
jgi:hypothetical protein